VRYFHWQPDKGIIDKAAFQETETIINLTGANIGEKRWTPQRKKEIVESRILSTRLLFETAHEGGFPIQTLISSSAVGYYGMVTSEEIFTESSPAGNDFLSSVCQAWETEALKFETIGTRVVVLRKGIVIGNGGAYKRLAPLARFGINTSLGSGKQYMPWLYINDLVNLYEFIMKNSNVSGIFNAVTNDHLTMKKMAKELSVSLQKPIFTPPAPAFAIRILLGEMAGMLLRGSRVSNQKLVSTGFDFELKEISKAFEILARK
jgi:uncharacterized protein (TIGR01777 family)